MNVKKIVLLAGLLLPTIILAQAEPKEITGSVPDLVSGITNKITSILWTIAATFSIIMFVIAGFKFLTAQGNPQKIDEAKKAVIWGVAGVAVIVLAWSAVAIVRLEFDV